MKGKHEIVVRNRRVQYKFTIERNITVLRGDSATGKTTLIDMILQHQLSGDQSGVDVFSDKPCVVLQPMNWQLILPTIHDSIIFIDEGGRDEVNRHFVCSDAFSNAARQSDNYYVIATRASLANLPYSVQEIYGIKNVAGNRCQKTKRLYSTFYPLFDSATEMSILPDLVIVEGTNAGYSFFAEYFARRNVRCLSASGKGNIARILREESYSAALVIADGAAFGSEVGNVLALQQAREFMLYLPESFEWIILKTDLLNDKEIRNILAEPSSHIDSKEYFSWERFFTALLTDRSRGTWMQYSKRKINPQYLQPAVMEKVTQILPAALRTGSSPENEG